MEQNKHGMVQVLAAEPDTLRNPADLDASMEATLPARTPPLSSRNGAV